MKAFASYELLVDVDHLLCGGRDAAAADDDPGSGRGGRDPPETTEAASLALSLLASVVAPQPEEYVDACELVLGARVLLVAWWVSAGEWGRELRREYSSSRSRIEGARVLEATWSPTCRRVGRGLLGVG